MGKNATKTQVRRLPNTLEAETKALAGGLKSSVVDTLGRGGIDEAFKELIGGALGIGATTEAPKPQEEAKPTTTDSGIVELFIAQNHKGEGAPKPKNAEKPKTESRQEAAMHYSADIKNNGERAVKKTHKTTEEKVADLKNELNQIAKSAPVRTEFAHMTLNQDTGRKKGKSDVNMLEFAIKMARASQAKTEDSGAWLKVGKGKHGKKGGMDLTQGKNHVTGERTTIQNSAG